MGNRFRSVVGVRGQLKKNEVSGRYISARRPRSSCAQRSGGRIREETRGFRHHFGGACGSTHGRPPRAPLTRFVLAAGVFLLSPRRGFCCGWKCTPDVPRTFRCCVLRLYGVRRSARGTCKRWGEDGGFLVFILWSQNWSVQSGVITSVNYYLVILRRACCHFG